MDYQNGKIYRIICNKTGLVYYGSTTQPLSKRKSCHKGHYGLYLQGKDHYRTSYEVLKNDDYEIVLVEDYPCERKEQLFARERYWIEGNECVNQNRPCKTTEEYREYKQVYRKTNKEYISQQTKEWNERNPERRRELARNYYHRKKAKEILNKIKADESGTESIVL